MCACVFHVCNELVVVTGIDAGAGGITWYTMCRIHKWEAVLVFEEEEVERT